MIYNTNKRVYLNLADTIKVNDLLRLHLFKPEGKDYWEYEAGWNDGLIAKEAGGTALPTNVARVREAAFGKLQSRQGMGGGTRKGNDALLAELAGMETRVAALEAELKRRDKQIELTAGECLKHSLDVADHFNRLIVRIKHHHLGDFKDLMMEIPK